MRLPGAWLLPLLAVSVAPLARAEELTCEFSGGAVGTAALDGAARRWGWVPDHAAGPPGIPPGAPFWFMSARIPDREPEGALAGSETPPASDYWAAAIHRRPSLVVLVELGSDAVRVLTISTVADAGGRRPASYARHIGGPAELRVEQLTGSCRSDAPGR